MESVEIAVGNSDGFLVDLLVGLKRCLVDTFDGMSVGSLVGVSVGELVGFSVVGINVCDVHVGIFEGDREGLSLGSGVGSFIVLCIGSFVGDVVGASLVNF